jgi:fructokinase
LDLVQDADAVCFGSLAQRHLISKNTIQQLVAAAPENARRIFDINLRQKFYSKTIIEQSLTLANVLKLNEEELVVLTKMFSLPADVHAQIEQLADTFGLKLVALTCGLSGSLFSQQGCWSKQASKTVKVADTVGAGDAFTAALTIGLLNKFELDDIHAAAVNLASYVCSQPGAMTALPQDFRCAQNPGPSNF